MCLLFAGQDASDEDANDDVEDVDEPDDDAEDSSEGLQKGDCTGEFELQCADGSKCIDAIFQCDIVIDCPDKSDEHAGCGAYILSASTRFCLLA